MFFACFLFPLPLRARVPAEVRPAVAVLLVEGVGSFLAFRPSALLRGWGEPLLSPAMLPGWGRTHRIWLSGWGMGRGA